jgi:hypothetical protein
MSTLRASEPVGIPIELQLTLKVVDDPACAEALAGGLTGGPPVSHQNSTKLSAKKLSDDVRQLNATSG